MSFFGLTGRTVQPDPMVAHADTKKPGPTEKIANLFNGALDLIRAARPSVIAERKEQERSQGLYPYSPAPRHMLPMEQADPANGRLGGRGSGGGSVNTRVEPTRPGTSGRVGGPSVSPPRKPLSVYMPSTTFPKTLD
jgi:hypothetical protein